MVIPNKLNRINISSTKRRLGLVFVTIIMAFLFILLFQPFSLFSNDGVSLKALFFELLFAHLVAAIVLLFTQLFLRYIFKVDNFTWITLLLWFLLESILVSISWSVLEWFDNQEQASLILNWVDNWLGFVLIMFAPYFVYVGVLQFKDLSKKANSIVNNDEVVDNVDISFSDESGVVKLIVKSYNLLFIQSADNYVEIHYIENDEVKLYLLRNTLKTVEQNYSNNNIIRCHRSYMVNVSKVESVKKVSNGFELVITNITDKTIPVSKSYSSEIMKKVSY